MPAKKKNVSPPTIRIVKPILYTPNNSFITEYYKTSGLNPTPHRANILKNEELYQLYKKPKKDKRAEIAHMNDIEPYAVMQADLLYLPDDKGYKYALVCVDVGTGYTDAEPLKERDAKAVLSAFKKVTTREPLKNAPAYILQTDAGSEFHGVFATYIKKLGVYHRYGKVGRSRQQAIVEQRNKVIGQALFTRMTGQELLTEQESTQWTSRLKEVIKYYNKYQKEKNARKKMTSDVPPSIPKGTYLLSIGQAVRVMLDKPKDTFDRKLIGHFRATDIRWSRKISHVSNIIIDDGQPILYQVDGHKTPAYTLNQLQPIDEKHIQDPRGELTVEGNLSDYTFVVKDIEDKRKVKNKIEYLIRWKGYPDRKDYTWEKKEELEKNPLVRKDIEEYERRKINK